MTWIRLPFIIKKIEWKKLSKRSTSYTERLSGAKTRRLLVVQKEVCSLCQHLCHLNQEFRTNLLQADHRMILKSFGVILSSTKTSHWSWTLYRILVAGSAPSIGPSRKISQFVKATFKLACLTKNISAKTSCSPRYLSRNWMVQRKKLKSLTYTSVAGLI